MITKILADFALALGHLNDAEFFAAVGMALFGLAALGATELIRNRDHAAASVQDPLDHDQAA